MSNNHIITREIGNLRGFSTDSIFLRPPNVADLAVNIQRAPDGTLQLRRGYQCQIAQIGGMGMGTFDDPATDEIHTVCIGTDGFLYNKLTKQIFLYYDGQVLGDISDITNANPANVESVGHGLQTGAQVILRDINGMNPLNNNTYTITVVDADNFTLDGVDSSLYPAYISGGYWSIAFADQRYLTFSIFTDPRFLTTNPGWSVAAWSITPWGAPSGESITCNIIVNRAAQINGNQANTNTINVKFGHELVATDTIQFTTFNGIMQQRTVISVTATSITFDGYPVTVLNGTYVSQFFDIPFRKGFDVTSPYLISTFIDTITNPTTGVHGLKVSVNGDTNKPAAFLQIVEPIIIDSSRFYSSLGWSIAPWSTSPWGSPSSPIINKYFEMDYWYWERVNFTISPPFPGTANPRYQNSPDFENASMAAFDDVIYIANGLDYPQKYDGQTVYRAGMPEGSRPNVEDDTSFISKPFSSGNNYQYITTYEQIDTRGHIVEGERSEIRNHQVGSTCALDVQFENLRSTFQNNWNTNGANATGSGVTVYGPDINGFYYDFVPVNVDFTLKIGDTAYYADQTSAVISAMATDSNVIPVLPGHAIIPGDIVYFIDDSDVEHLRIVASTTPTSITIRNEPVTVDPSDPDHSNILSYRNGLVFGNVAILDGDQSNVNTLTVFTGHTVQLNDVVQFLDSFNNLQRRNVTSISGTTITIDGIPVTVSDLYLIASTNQRADAITIQRLNPNAITFVSNSPISNNLRINIYRTLNNSPFGVTGKLYFVASVPNDSSGVGLQTYVDGIPDLEILNVRQFDDPDVAPNPPPISKYVRAFGNQMFYGGGEQGNAENSDRVFFSEGNLPENVPLATHFFNVPSVDDDVTGIGVAGSTLVITKNRSLWAIAGNFLSGNAEIIQIAPGTNIGCVAHATIASVGTLMYFVHTNGVYAITENQLFPTDAFGNPVPISLAIDVIFRETKFLPQTRYVLKRAVAVNYTKDNQYLLFLPCEDAQSSIRTANAYSTILCYDYQEKNWFQWFNMNAAGGMVIIDDNLYFQERRFSAVDGNTANLYKQHRFYRLVDHADHAGPQYMEWRSSWEDLGQPEVRKKFCRCILLLDRLSELFQFNNPEMNFSTYLNRIPNLQNTMAKITQVDNIRNSSWSYSGWGWNYWSGYQDSFITVNLKQGTVAKSIQVGFTMKGINMDMKFAGFQLEVIPENRRSVLR